MAQTQIRTGGGRRNQDRNGVVQPVSEADHPHRILDKSRQRRVLEERPLYEVKFGFNGQRIVREARKIEWEDEELLSFLKWGFEDYSNDRLPVCVLIPNQVCVSWKSKPFYRVVKKEIYNCWFSTPISFPRTLP